VLKLLTDQGATIYMSAQPYIKNLSGYRVKVWLKSDDISFKEYLKGFFAIAHIRSVEPKQILRYRVSQYLIDQHNSDSLGRVSAALITATPIDKQMREQLAALGISHLLAISGFHLGVLSVLIFFILRPIYTTVQNRYFPYRHGNRDLFIMVALILFAYLMFLGLVPSVLRAFVMMVVGFVLYDRGIKVLNFQTLTLAIMFIIALFPKLIFSIGLWLSVAGVFYIFLFLKLSEDRSKVFQFIALHIWVYILMVPYALYIFGIFSIYHPLSILYTMLFVLFYPLVLLLHLLGAGALVDIALKPLLTTPIESFSVELHYSVLAVLASLSLLAIRYKSASLAAGAVGLSVTIYALLHYWW